MKTTNLSSGILALAFLSFLSIGCGVNAEYMRTATVNCAAQGNNPAASWCIERNNLERQEMEDTIARQRAVIALQAFSAGLGAASNSLSNVQRCTTFGVGNVWQTICR